MKYKELWLDLETTGTNHQKHGIVQIAAVPYIDGVEQEAYVHYVRPFPIDEIEDSALKVNGIQREQLDTFPSPEECYAGFTAFMGRFIDQYDSNDKFLICGYNVKFDTDFMRIFFQKNNDQYYGSWFQRQPLDVLQTAVLYFHLKGIQQPQSMRLNDAAEGLGMDIPENIHDAKVDIDLTRRVYLELAKRIER